MLWHWDYLLAARASSEEGLTQYSFDTPADLRSFLQGLDTQIDDWLKKWWVIIYYSTTTCTTGWTVGCKAQALCWYHEPFFNIPGITYSRASKFWIMNDGCDSGLVSESWSESRRLSEGLQNTRPVLFLWSSPDHQRAVGIKRHNHIPLWKHKMASLDFALVTEEVSPQADTGEWLTRIMVLCQVSGDRKEELSCVRTY